MCGAAVPRCLKQESSWWQGDDPGSTVSSGKGILSSWVCRWNWADWNLDLKWVQPCNLTNKLPGTADWARKHEALQQRGHFPWEGRAGPSTLQGHLAVPEATGATGSQPRRAAGPVHEGQELISAWSLSWLTGRGVCSTAGLPAEPSVLPALPLSTASPAKAPWGFGTLWIVPEPVHCCSTTDLQHRH